MINLIIIWAIAILIAIVSIVIRKIAQKKEKNINLTILRRICMLSIGVVCSLPIILDLIMAKRPVASYAETSINVQILDYEEIQNVGEIIDGETMEQTFYCDLQAISTIELYTQTYGRSNWGKLYIELVDYENDKVLQTWEEELIDIPNNDYLILELEDPFEMNVYGKFCSIRIHSEGAFSGNCITLIQTENQYNNGDLISRGTTTDNDMVFKVNGYKNMYSRENTRVWACLMMLVCMEFVVYGMVREKEQNV